MAIKVQKSVFDDAVLDLIGSEFRFDHITGLAEWLTDSCESYLRESRADDEQYSIVRLEADGAARLRRIECIDFLGMTKDQIEKGFDLFLNRAANRSMAGAPLKTLGTRRNGARFYMRQMFETSKVITYREHRLNIVGFNALGQCGFEEGFEDRAISLPAAMKEARIASLELPPAVETALAAGEIGFTVVVGEQPENASGSEQRQELVDRLVLHPQARRLIDRKPICLLLDNQKTAARLRAPKLSPKEGFERAVVIDLPEVIEWKGKPLDFKNSRSAWPGRLVLKTSDHPLRGKLSALNTIDCIGDGGVVASYRIPELGSIRFSGQSQFILGECESPIFEDPEHDFVRTDRQKLLESDRSLALLDWVRAQVEVLAGRIENSYPAPGGTREAP